MPRYTVTLQIFAASGDDIDVCAPTEEEAVRRATEIAKERFLGGAYELDLHEICTSCVNQTGPDMPDPALFEWVRMCDVQHPLRPGALILSRQGEEDENDFGEERHTGPNAVGVVDAVDYWPESGQGWAYGVHFEHADIESVYVRIDEGEYMPTNRLGETTHHNQPDDYLVAVG